MNETSSAIHEPSPSMIDHHEIVNATWTSHHLLRSWKFGPSQPMNGSNTVVMPCWCAHSIHHDINHGCHRHRWQVWLLGGWSYTQINRQNWRYMAAINRHHEPGSHQTKLWCRPAHEPPKHQELTVDLSMSMPPCMQWWFIAMAKLNNVWYYMILPSLTKDSCLVTTRTHLFVKPPALTEAWQPWRVTPFTPRILGVDHAEHYLDDPDPLRNCLLVVGWSSK